MNIMEESKSFQIIENYTNNHSTIVTQAGTSNLKIATQVSAGNSKITARAGAGKTTYILKKIDELKKNGLLVGKYGAIVLVFSHSARDDFQRRLIMATDAINPTQVMTLHCLAGKLSGSTARSIELVIWKATQELENGTCDNLHKKLCTKTVKYIFVDEAQDLSPIQFQMIEQLQRATKASVTYVGDDRQCIYQFQGSESNLLDSIEVETEQTLNVNYRSPQEILDVANIVANCQLQAHNNRRGKNPVLVVQNRSQLCETITEIAIQCLKTGNVAIIGPVKTGKGNNIGLQAIRNHMTGCGMSPAVHYKLSSESDAQQGDVDISVTEPNLLTIHASKGLEFDTVIVIDAHHKLQNKIPTEEDADAHKNMIYVAITRARSQLYVCIDQTAQISSFLLPAVHLFDKHEPFQPGPKVEPYTFAKNQNKEIAKLSALIATKGNMGILETLTTNQQIPIPIGQIQEAIYIGQMEPIAKECLKKLFAYCARGIGFIEELAYRWNRVIIISDKGIWLLSQPLVLDKKTQLLVKVQNLPEDVKAQISTAMKSGNSVVLVHSSRGTACKTIVKKIATNLQRLQAVDSDDILIEVLFEISLYNFAFEKNADHILNVDRAPALKLIKNVYPNIQKIASTFLENDCQINAVVSSQKMDLFGHLDVITPESIAIFSFSDQFTIADRVNIFLSGLVHDPARTKRRELINLRTGQREVVQTSPEITQLVLRECFTVAKKKIRGAIILYDFETTGIDTGSCEIIDRCFYDCDTNTFLSQGLVKANFIPPEIEQLTGISREMVQHGDTPAKFKQQLQDILKIYKHPYFIAHNGSTFDDKILARYMGPTFVSKIQFADSMRFLPVLVQAKSKKLQDVHSALFGEGFVQTHRAHDDVKMLANIINHNTVRNAVDLLLKSTK